MLDPNPASRASMAEVMRHPWFVADLDRNVVTMHLQALAMVKQHQPAQQPEGIKRVVLQVRQGPRGPEPQYPSLR
jgi:hypothetical protein